MTLLDAVEKLNVENFSSLSVAMEEAIKEKLDALDDRILMADNPTDEMETQFDELAEIDDLFTQDGADAEINEDADAIKDVIRKIKESIISYQKYYGGLKSLKVKYKEM